MKRFHAVLGMVVLLFLAHPSQSQELPLVKDGIGPLVVTSLNITVKGSIAEAHAKIRNDSKRPIQFAQFCVQSAVRKRGCDLYIWTNHVWAPGEEIEWIISVPAVPGIERSSITVDKLKAPPLPKPETTSAPKPAATPKPDPKFQAVHRIYVEPIEGNLGALTREQLMAALANSGRFQAVDDSKLADAVIKGQAESHETGTASATTNNAVVGGVSVLASGSAKGTIKTQTLTEKTIAIHLSLPSGDILGAGMVVSLVK